MINFDFFSMSENRDQIFLNLKATREREGQIKKLTCSRDTVFKPNKVIGSVKKKH